MSTTDNTPGTRTPEQIRAEIDATRGTLGYDVDALADKVNPAQIRQRQVDKVKNRFTNMKESVTGTVHNTTDTASSTAGSAVDTAQGAGQQAAGKVNGNPLAVGLVAFGAGWLLSSLIPAAEKEQDLAGHVKDKTAPLVDHAKYAAQEAAQNLKGPMQDAVASVKDAAQDAAGTIKDEAQGAASDVKDSAQDSKDTVQNSRPRIAMQITYDTVTDSISSPGITSEQNAPLQAELATALYRNEPVQTVAATIMAAVRRLASNT